MAISLGNQAQYLVSSVALAAIGVGQLPLRPADPSQMLREFERKLRLVGTIATPRSAAIGSRIEPPPADLKERDRQHSGLPEE